MMKVRTSHQLERADPMKEATLIGIDLAKEVFQLHGVDFTGKEVFRKRLTKKKLIEFMVQHPKCTVVMEACGSSHHWARTFSSMGHEAKLIAPNFVKPFLKSNKNDAQDAAAICEAAQRPSMRFVSVKSEQTQGIQCVIRTRQQFIAQKVAVKNSIHALLYEFGLSISKSSKLFLKDVFEAISDDSSLLPSPARVMVRLLVDQLTALEELIKKTEREISSIAEQSHACKRLQTIPGVGLISSVAMLAHAHNIKDFKSSRDFSASLGLVPRQYSSGTHQTLGHISKRGDKSMRCLLIHGARSVLRLADAKSDSYHKWCKSVKERRGYNRAACAVANKNARIIWALLTGEDEVFLAA